MADGRAGSQRPLSGDNFDVLRRHVSDESVDLVYLDPPFNSDLFGPVRPRRRRSPYRPPLRRLSTSTSSRSAQAASGADSAAATAASDSVRARDAEPAARRGSVVVMMWPARVERVE